MKNEASDISKMFNTTDFGYRRITVERPLQLSYYPHDADKLESLQNDKAFKKLGDLGAEVLTSLAQMPEQIDDREVFSKALEENLAIS